MTAEAGQITEMLMTSQIASVRQDLGCHGAAGKDFVSWGPYLAGMGRDMELRHLRYFVAGGEEGRLTPSGERRLHNPLPQICRPTPGLEVVVGVGHPDPRGSGVESSGGA